MTNFIPLFPLGIVVYPGEQLNLHIFEPRYKQLITDSVAASKPFGIPTVLNGNVTDTGTTVVVKQIVKQYTDGCMDIKTEAEQVFTLLETIPTLPDKMYQGAIVTYPNYSTTGSFAKMQKLLLLVKALHKLIQVQKQFGRPDNELCTYDIAHHVGFTLQQEYELLTIPLEIQRQEYVQRHLQSIIPILSEMENLKTKIHLNGHFKQLKGLE